MAKIFYTMTLTDREHEAMTEFMNRYFIKYSERLRIEGRSRGPLERAANKLNNSKTVMIANTYTK